MNQYVTATAFGDCPSCHQPMLVHTFEEQERTFVEEHCNTCDHQETLEIAPDFEEGRTNECQS